MCRGYTGPTCEIDIDECLNQPCDNGATCANEPGSFRCICPPNLTGSNCGDPMYSNTIRSKIFPFTISNDHYVIIGGGCMILLLLVIVSGALVCVCKKRRRRHRLSPNNRKYEAQPVINNPMDNRTYKMSNLAAINNQGQRPASYAATANSSGEQVPLNNAAAFAMNLETLRSYGSAGDELDDAVFAKPSNHDQCVNINNGNASDNNSHKQLHPNSKCFQALKQLSPSAARPVYRATGVLPGKLVVATSNGQSMPVTMPPPNQTHSATYEEGSYHWDCSDWGLRRSQNPLPNITSVPGNEIADTSSFHSNESNESQPMLSKHTGIQKMMIALPPDVNGGSGGGGSSSLQVVDPVRDIDTLNEELESSDQVGSNSEFENLDMSLKPMSQFANTDSINCLNRMDSSSEDYQYNTGGFTTDNADSDGNGISIIFIVSPAGSNLSSYPNAYLLQYNIQSETDYESERSRLNPTATGGGSKVMNNNSKLVNSDTSQQIIDSDNEDDEDDDEIPAYGFPSQPSRSNVRNRCEARDIDQLISDGGE